MRETFCFPGYGCPTEIASVQITPQWQAKQLDDSLRLIGIYHVTAHVRFDFQEAKEIVDMDDLVKIDALDLQGDTGYFEYAVPLHVDLPKDVSIDNLMVKDVRPSLTNQTCELEWTIATTFSEPEQTIQVAHVPEEQSTPALETLPVAAAEPVAEVIPVVAAELVAEVIPVVAAEPVAEAIPVAAAVPVEVALPDDEKVVLAKESTSQIVVRESSLWHQDAPSMIWELEEHYTLLKVRPSNDVLHQ